MKKIFSAFLCLYVITGIAFATEHYVRPGATGTGTGADWTNAYTSLPATLVRGDTYYLADGTYGGYTFNTPASGTSVITVKKATVSSHGTSTGWDDSYGDGQVTFTTWVFTTSYWMVDGVTGSGTSGYGIVVQPPSVANVITLTGSVSNLTFRYIEAKVFNEGTTYVSIPDSPSYYSHIVKATTGTTTAINFSNVYFHHVFGCIFQTVGSYDWVVENSRLYKNKSTGTQHAGTLCDHRSNHHIWRNNYIMDPDGTAVWDLIEAGGNNDNTHIYNNVVWNSGGADWGAYTRTKLVGVYNDASNSRSATNWRVYNNTFVNIKGNPAIIINTGGGNIVKNNLFYCNRTDISYTNYSYISGPGITHGYNAYIMCAMPGAQASAIGPTDYAPGLTWGPNCPYTSGTNPLIDWQNGNFQLTSITPVRDIGENLGSAYNVDIAGTSRPQGAAWDIGAYEYSSGTPVKIPNPPSILVIQ